MTLGLSERPEIVADKDDRVEVADKDDRVEVSDKASELDEPQGRGVSNGGSSRQEVEDSALQVNDWNQKTKH